MSRRTPIRRRTLPALALTASLLSACHDATSVMAPELTASEVTAPELSDAPAVAALDGGTAALLSIVLEDALDRLLPVAGAGHHALHEALATLTASLADADAVTLDGQLDNVRVALASDGLEPADADALRLALDELTRALGVAGPFEEAAR